MSDTPSVQSNVPMPKVRPRHLPLYPWLTMKPGDSFVVYGRVAAAASRGSFGRYQRMGKIAPNMKCVQRREEGTEDGVRVWLVEG
jgi:hypothetical protein